MFIRICLFDLSWFGMKKFEFLSDFEWIGVDFDLLKCWKILMKYQNFTWLRWMKKDIGPMNIDQNQSELIKLTHFGTFCNFLFCFFLFFVIFQPLFVGSLYAIYEINVCMFLYLYFVSFCYCVWIYSLSMFIWYFLCSFLDRTTFPCSK